MPRTNQFPLSENHVLSKSPNPNIILFEQYVRAHESTLRKLGIGNRDLSIEAINLFSELPSARQESVLRDLSISTSVSSEIEKERGHIEESLAFELSSLEKALKLFDLHFQDSEILNKIDQGDILEVYTHEGIQIYRSWTYFKFCHYSISELLVYDWNTLFLRPSWVVEQIMKLLPELYSPKNRLFTYDIPAYLVTEGIFDSKRTMLYKMKFAAPLFNTKDEVVAVLTTGALQKVISPEVGAAVSII